MPPTPRSQGPKKKSAVRVPSVGGGGGSNRRLILMIGVAGVVVVAAALGSRLLGSSNSAASSDAPKLLQAAGCTITSVNALKGEHTIATPSGTSKKWNTSPPTSGPHYQVPAIWGAYTEPLLPAQVVHNLEHGGIFIQYGARVPRTTVDELTTFYDAHQNGTLLAPLPTLGDKVALGAWTTSGGSSNGTAHLAKCTAFDEKAFSTFFDAYQFNGPERFPSSALTPGS